MSRPWRTLDRFPAQRAESTHDRRDWMRAFVSAPADASRQSGDGWTLELKPGWHVADGKRSGDYVLARK